MEQNPMMEYIRVFYKGVLAIVLLFALALLSSFVGSFGGGSLPDEAYGITETPDFILPDDPILKIHVWEKDFAERRKLIPLPARTKVNTGPILRWGDNYEFVPASRTFGMDGLTLTAESAGMITVRWEHERCDCGFTHTWWYSPDPKITGQMDTARLNRSYDGTAQGTNTVTLLWRGDGGKAADTLTYAGDPAADTRHTVETGEGDLASQLTRDSLTLLIHIESRNLLGRLNARATVRVTMQSGWREAGGLWAEESLHIPRNAEGQWLDYALVQPSWTVQLISYTEV